ncbi:D-alanyl-D-alanine carboxypeptidase [Candidatus Gottesmanbacteria bacterium]|nr:D-alanyl-D-alanine carboxypeptidase [Candidatus Gottesmanbacteria bacterium]
MLKLLPKFQQKYLPISYNFKFSFHFDKQSFYALNWRVFFVSLILGFLLAFVQNIIAGLPNISPLSFTSTTDNFYKLLPKLENIPNNFSLTTKQSFIPQTFASGSFDQATAYTVVDLDSGKVIAEKDLTGRHKIASITKIMTAIVALDLASPEEYFTATRRAAREQPTKIGLVVGQKMKLEELLNAVLLTSANDAAAMIKDGIDAKYGSSVFIRAMNAKASFLDLKNTSFDNPQGYDGDLNYSSVGDLAILTNYALTNYPLIRDIVEKDYQFLAQDSYHKQYDLYNWNGLLDVYPQVKGVKIGNTDKAGKTTVVVSEREGKKLVAILLGAPGVLERDLWTADLLDYGYHEEYGLEEINITESDLKHKYSTWQYFH